MANALEPRDFIAIAGIAVGASAALVVAHLHRKQMRQIEAYRSNPSVGLVPPPNPIRVFVKRYHVLIFAAIICSFLVWEASSNSPVRAKDVILIAALVAALVMYWILDLRLRHLSITKYLAGIVQEHLRITKELAAIQPTELQRRDQKDSGDLASHTAAHTQAQVD